MNDFAKNNLDAELGPTVARLKYLSQVLAYDELESTNDHALELQKRGQLSGSVIICDKQTHGRGRLKRSWVCAPGDVTMSILLRPPHLPAQNQLSLLPIFTALAVVKALKNLGLDVGLKWPNDIVFEPAQGEQMTYFGRHKKLGGILIENVFSGAQVGASIIGVGLNIVHRPDLCQMVPHRGSLEELGFSTGRVQFLEQFLYSFDLMIGKFHDTDFLAAALSEYEQHCRNLGRHVVVERATQTIRGVATGLTDQGFLVIKDGEFQHIINAGDVGLWD